MTSAGSARPPCAARPAPRGGTAPGGSASPWGLRPGAAAPARLGRSRVGLAVGAEPHPASAASASALGSWPWAGSRAQGGQGSESRAGGTRTPNLRFWRPLLHAQGDGHGGRPLAGAGVPVAGCRWPAPRRQPPSGSDHVDNERRDDEVRRCSDCDRQRQGDGAARVEAVDLTGDDERLGRPPPAPPPATAPSTAPSRAHGYACQHDIPAAAAQAKARCRCLIHPVVDDAVAVVVLAVRSPSPGSSGIGVVAVAAVVDVARGASQSFEDGCVVAEPYRRRRRGTSRSSRSRVSSSARPSQSSSALRDRAPGAPG